MLKPSDISKAPRFVAIYSLNLKNPRWSGVVPCFNIRSPFPIWLQATSQLRLVFCAEILISESNIPISKHCESAKSDNAFCQKLKPQWTITVKKESVE